MSHTTNHRAKELQSEIERLRTDLSRYKEKDIFKEMKIKDLKKEVEQLKSGLFRNKKEKRSSERMIVTLVTELFYGGVNYIGLIENLSEDGLYLRICPLKSAKDIMPGETLKLKLHLPSREKLDVTCDVKWSHKTPPYGLNCVGVHIMGSHTQYREFLNNSL